MLWTPQKGILRCEHNSPAVASQLMPGTQITSGASASTKGAWSTLIAATAFDSYFMFISLAGLGAPNNAWRGAVDIGIGAATEEVIIADLLCGGAAGYGSTSGLNGPPKTWAFPLYIPSGSRLAGRYASDRTSFAAFLGIWLYGGHGSPPFRVGTKVTTYGTGTVPGGTAITPGASGAEGAWTQIISATSEDHFAVFPSFQVNDGSATAKTYGVDIGIGAATEEELASQYWYGTNANEAQGGPFPFMPTWADMPSGSRLCMRAQCNGALDAAYEASLHAVS